MRSRASRLMPVAILVGAFALTGCSGDGGDGKAADEPTGAKEAWLEGNRLDAELDQAVERLTRQCMEVKGFTVHPYGASENNLWVFNPEDLINPRTRGPKPTVEQARKNGYGFDPRGGGTEGVTETSYDDGRAQLVEDALESYLVDRETRLFYRSEYVKASPATARELLKR